MLKGFQGDASTQVMDDCYAVVSKGLWIVELPASPKMGVGGDRAVMATRI